MPAKTATVFVIHDDEVPTIPPRSHLYCLEPVGIGTPFVESLTIYVTRLAKAHCVSLKSLVMKEILPVLGKECKTRAAYNLLSGFWAAKALSLNGTGSSARGFQVDHAASSKD